MSRRSALTDCFSSEVKPSQPDFSALERGRPFFLGPERLRYRSGLQLLGRRANKVKPYYLVYTNKGVKRGAPHLERLPF